MCIKNNVFSTTKLVKEYYLPYNNVVEYNLIFTILSVVKIKNPQDSCNKVSAQESEDYTKYYA